MLKSKSHCKAVMPEALKIYALYNFYRYTEHTDKFTENPNTTKYTIIIHTFFMATWDSHSEFFHFYIKILKHFLLMLRPRFKLNCI